MLIKRLRGICGELALIRDEFAAAGASLLCKPG